jgi:hypothetical protein
MPKTITIQREREEKGKKTEFQAGICGNSFMMVYF